MVGGFSKITKRKELTTELLPRRSKKCQALGYFDVMIF
jgi:hypothetical protein